ncbi:MAG: hypothetical protein IKT42_04550 [Clostridia bacterium]|nr:hypothetical protein [Clostridia bacterium]
MRIKLDALSSAVYKHFQNKRYGGDGSAIMSRFGKKTQEVEFNKCWTDFAGVEQYTVTVRPQKIEIKEQVIIKRTSANRFLVVIDDGREIIAEFVKTYSDIDELIRKYITTLKN